MKWKLMLTAIFALIFTYFPSADANARFCMANQMTLYGTVATTTSASTVDECAYQTWEAGNKAFGYDGSSQCKQFSALTGYSQVADATFTFYIQDDTYSGTTCMAPASMISLIHTLVYNGNNCPSAFTYNPTDDNCQSTMSQTACNEYQAAWAYPYMPSASFPCVLYPNSQTTYADGYYCQNYFAIVQIFKGNAYCFANFTITSAQATNKNIIANDGCNFVFDADSHSIIPSGKTEVDWLFATYGTVMIGAYLQGSFNTAGSYYFYDNSSASSFVTGTLNLFSNMGFLYTDGTQVTSASSIPNNILMCKTSAIQSTC